MTIETLEAVRVLVCILPALVCGFGGALIVMTLGRVI